MHDNVAAMPDPPGRRRSILERERNERAAIEARPWEPLLPAERIARLMNLGDTGSAHTATGGADWGYWRTVAEIAGERTITERWDVNGLLLTAYKRLVSAVRTNADTKLSVWTVRTGPKSTITVWLHRQTQILYAKRTGPRARATSGSPAETLAGLFRAASGKVLRCLECGRWFARIDQRQRACSTSCADRNRKRQQRGGDGRRTPVQRANLAPVRGADYGLGYFTTGQDWIGGTTNWNARQEAARAASETENASTMGPAQYVPVRFNRPRSRSRRTPRRD
jgi:hypothetical protein